MLGETHWHAVWTSKEACRPARALNLDCTCPSQSTVSKGSAECSASARSLMCPCFIDDLTHQAVLNYFSASIARPVSCIHRDFIHLATTAESPSFGRAVINRSFVELSESDIAAAGKTIYELILHGLGTNN